ncbi:MAG: nitroreductase family protein, partial [Bacteroidales bacterium]|nr:nitroreductase family protein [Bacteroidales bacterium]
MEFSKVIAARHSVRSFKDRGVDREVIDAILDQTATAPSSKNSRSSAFMVVDDRDTLLALSEMRSSGSALLKGAACAIVVLGDTSKTDL